MNKCPKCNEEIDHLCHYVKGENYYHFWVNEDGTEEYETQEFLQSGEQNDYDCPECGETLFHTEEEAKEFLK